MKKTFRSASAIFALALIGAATPVRAQQVGDRVRVVLPDSTTIGEVTAVSGEGFEIVRDSTLFSFDYRLIESLDRSVGRKRLWLEGAARGAMIPLRIGSELIVGCGRIVGDAGGGPVVSVVAYVFCFIPGVTIMVVGAPIGAVVGGIAGIFIHREEWAAVPLDGRPGRLSLLLPRFGPERRVGLELGVRIRLP
ncbi:hypothetical protein [Candidatus Palauibacter sp.]|uniref:hypothetical protein n=1 Tax=Candidatus Palauibacter sp. TaxID=3101350 RepID=UPI003AF2D7B5